MEHFVGLENALKDSYVIAGQPKHLLLGLSGGADSIALAKLLNSLQKTCQFELTCVHVNHGLRKSADEDEQFVIQTCESWKIPHIVKHVNISSAGNIESKAREARYKAFYEAKAELSADCLVLAHHMDDQAETIMMRLM
ncbi:MAG: tRNA lysidine(34) synthetase TilS, partial [Clostridiales bacterium]|nr:tRNA lysidine(34) synthetase TilS [Clostridiales bacterium]